jgi:nucleoside-diphosphate-sugar epimerase
MRVLVLGGTGLIGRAIVGALLPRHQVTVLSRGNQPLRDERIVQLVADRGEPIEMLSALTGPAACVVDVSGTEPASVRNVLCVLDKTRYAFVTSAVVYAREKVRPPFGDDDSAGGDPIWGEYAEAKAACEAILRRAPTSRCGRGATFRSDRPRGFAHRQAGRGGCGPRDPAGRRSRRHLRPVR